MAGIHDDSGMKTMITRTEISGDFKKKRSIWKDKARMQDTLELVRLKRKNNKLPPNPVRSIGGLTYIPNISSRIENEKIKFT